MKLFTFDFVPYGGDLRGRLGYPVGRRNFDPEIAAQSYQDHIEQFQLCEEVGFDGISLNEHHGSPYSLDNSPNVFLAHVARATTAIKLTMFGNLLPLHAHPLRVAEELAMLDVITRGRLIAGFARGIPREHLVYNVPLSESRARFEEALEVILETWTSELLTHDGQFFHYESVDTWPRPYQQPHPPVWVGAIGTETTRWIAQRPELTLGVNFLPTAEVKKQLQAYRQSTAEAGRKVTDDNIVYGRHIFVAETQAEAERTCKPHAEYYFQDLVGQIGNASIRHIRQRYPDVAFDAVKPAFDYATASMKTLREHGLLLVGTPERVYAELLEQYEEVGGFGTLLAMIRMGTMPQEVVLRTIRLIGEELIPRLHSFKASVGKEETDGRGYPQTHIRSADQPAQMGRRADEAGGGTTPRHRQG